MKFARRVARRRIVEPCEFPLGQVVNEPKSNRVGQLQLYQGGTRRFYRRFYVAIHAVFHLGLSLVQIG